jgi:hypothetical protein
MLTFPETEHHTRQRGHRLPSSSAPTFVAMCLGIVVSWANGAKAEPLASPPNPDRQMFALIVGVNQSVDASLPMLLYADDDAVRYHELFRTLGARTYLLTRPDANTRQVFPEAVTVAREPRAEELW